MDESSHWALDVDSDTLDEAVAWAVVEEAFVMQCLVSVAFVTELVAFASVVGPSVGL